MLVYACKGKRDRPPYTKVIRGGIMMNLEEIQHLFHEKYNFKPATLNELLTFTRKCYIVNEITINEYRQLVKEIEAAFPLSESPTV
jgi:hypothetical protein